MPKCDFNKIAIEIILRPGCSSANLQHFFRTIFPKNNSEGLLLIIVMCCYLPSTCLKFCLILKTLIPCNTSHSGFRMEDM